MTPKMPKAAPVPDEGTGGAEFIPELMLCGVNTAACCTYLVDKPEFVLGKSREECDGVMDFSGEISRVHAKVLWREGRYFLQDQNSTNRTFLNGRPVPPMMDMPLAPGDRVSFSTWQFTVEKINR